MHGARWCHLPSLRSSTLPTLTRHRRQVAAPHRAARQQVRPQSAEKDQQAPATGEQPCVGGRVPAPFHAALHCHWQALPTTRTNCGMPCPVPCHAQTYPILSHCLPNHLCLWMGSQRHSILLHRGVVKQAAHVTGQGRILKKHPWSLLKKPGRAPQYHTPCNCCYCTPKPK